MSRSAPHDERNLAFRTGLATLEASRAAGVPTRAVVVAECERLAVSLREDDVPESDGAKIHWIGDTSPENVLFYFHGGGFAMPCFPGHVTFLVQTQQKMEAQGTPFAIAFLEYGLSPKYKFSTQHMQGVKALNHILQSGRKASNIIVGGDSAGGNLAIGMISASFHSHESIPSLKIDGPLKGALLISPWTSFSADTKSYSDNRDKDIIAEGIMFECRNDFVSYPTKDPFAEPSLADSKWWEKAPVSSILNLAGGYEIFLDYIKDLGVKMKEAGLNVQTVECPQQVHIDCILDAQAGFEPGPMSLAVWEWLAKVL